MKEAPGYQHEDGPDEPGHIHTDPAVHFMQPVAENLSFAFPSLPVNTDP
jgi:hypothetical protein